MSQQLAALKTLEAQNGFHSPSKLVFCLPKKGSGLFPRWMHAPSGVLGQTEPSRGQEKPRSHTETDVQRKKPGVTGQKKEVFSLCNVDVCMRLDTFKSI